MEFIKSKLSDDNECGEFSKDIQGDLQFPNVLSKRNQNMYKISALLITFSFIVGGCSLYNKNLKTAYAQVKTLSASSILVSEQISSTWNSAIFDHNYTFGNKSEYVSDFNNALLMLMSEPEIIAVNKNIDSLGNVLKISMNKLIDPPSKLKDTYDDMVSLYSSVSELSKMATNPSGSLQTYRQNLNDLASKINSKISEIEIRNPELQDNKK